MLRYETICSFFYGILGNDDFLKTLLTFSLKSHKNDVLLTKQRLVISWFENGL